MHQNFPKRFENQHGTSFCIYLSPKKIWIKKIIFFSEKNHFENFDFRFFFSNLKKKSRKSKNRFSKKDRKNWFSKKNMFFRFFIFSQNVDFFFEIEIFKIIFLQEKLLFFAYFFLMKGLWKNLIHTDFWSGSRILSVSGFGCILLH